MLNIKNWTENTTFKCSVQKLRFFKNEILAYIWKYSNSFCNVCTLNYYLTTVSHHVRGQTYPYFVFFCFIFLLIHNKRGIVKLPWYFFFASIGMLFFCLNIQTHLKRRWKNAEFSLFYTKIQANPSKNSICSNTFIFKYLFGLIRSLFDMLCILLLTAFWNS